MKTLPNINFHHLRDKQIMGLIKNKGKNDASNEMDFSFLTVYNLLLDHKK
jgi:hypothetical protein